MSGLEAGIKYFLVGIFASAVMIFGLALLYGTAGTAYLDEITRVLPGIIGQPVVVVGLLLTLSGFFFKLAVFPFHFWAPDVYQGAMNQVAAYIATASKVAAIAVLMRVIASAGEGSTYLVHVLVVLVDRFHDGGQPGGHRSEGFEKAAGLFDHCPCRLCPDRDFEPEHRRVCAGPSSTPWPCW